jgi:hypothetical protein
MTRTTVFQIIATPAATTIRKVVAVLSLITPRTMVAAFRRQPGTMILVVVTAQAMAGMEAWVVELCLALHSTVQMDPT